MQTGDAQPEVANLDVTPERPQVRLAALAGVLAAGSLVLSSGVESEAVRLRILSGFLLVLAAAEGFFGLAALFRPRQFESEAPGIYMRQHLGLYNLFAVLLYLFAALDPLANRAVIHAVIALYVVHAGSEFWCFLRLAPPGMDDSFRPRATYLTDGATLLAVILPVVVFYP